MKILHLIITFYFLTSISVFAQTEQVSGVRFLEVDWASALSKAKQENKLIFLDIYASWCGPCKKLKRTTFANEKLGTFFNEQFICVAVDGEKGEGPKLARHYSVRGYPTLLFIDGLGNVVHKEVGYIRAKHLHRIGDNVFSKHVNRKK